MGERVCTRSSFHIRTSSTWGYCISIGQAVAYRGPSWKWSRGLRAQRHQLAGTERGEGSPSQAIPEAAPSCPSNTGSPFQATTYNKLSPKLPPCPSNSNTAWPPCRREAPSLIREGTATRAILTPNRVAPRADRPACDEPVSFPHFRRVASTRRRRPPTPCGAAASVRIASSRAFYPFRRKGRSAIRARKSRAAASSGRFGLPREEVKRTKMAES